MGLLETAIGNATAAAAVKSGAVDAPKPTQGGGFGGNFLNVLLGKGQDSAQPIEQKEYTPPDETKGYLIAGAVIIVALVFVFYLLKK